MRDVPHSCIADGAGFYLHPSRGLGREAMGTVEVQAVAQGCTDAVPPPHPLCTDTDRL